MLAALRERTGNPDLDPDDQGDVPIRYGSALVWVRVDRKVPAVDVFSYVLSDVEPAAGLLEALNELTRAHRPAAFFVANSRVVATLRVDCGPLYPPRLIEAVRFLGKLVDEVDEDLGSRFGGKTAFDQGRPAGEDTACARPN